MTECQNQSDPDYSHGFYIAQVSRVAFKMLTLHEKNVCVCVLFFFYIRR